MTFSIKWICIWCTSRLIIWIMEKTHKTVKKLIDNEKMRKFLIKYKKNFLRMF